MKKIFSAILALCMSASLIVPANAQTKGYNDVNSQDWFYDSVNFVTENNMMAGVSDDEFAPNANVTRGMFVTILYRFDGEPAFMNDNVFSDVESGSYYEKAVVWASGKGIVNGVSQDEFAPNSSITREQMATIVMNYAKYKEANTDVTADVSSFADFDTQTADYAKAAMCYCVGEGVLSGKAEDLLAPKDNATRAETAAIMVKVYDLFTKTDDIVVLYTNDVHCGIEDGIGYAGVSAYKKRMEQTNKFVTLVDSGDAIQGDTIGTFSKGEYIIDVMNNVGYDYAILGNHEFDYGMEQLSKLIAKSDAKYLNSNVKYTGKGKSALENTTPYEIKDYGNVKVGYVGVSTPFSITTATPKHFMENDKYVYNFSADTEQMFYDCVQESVDSCKADGADIIVLLSHCGDYKETDVEYPLSSQALIENTKDIDVVLDAHAHNVIESESVQNKDGEDVILTSTGTRFENIGKLVIKADGSVSASLVNDYKGKDIGVVEYIGEIKENCNSVLNTKIGTNNTELSITDENGIRMIRNRELAIGDLCADALRIGMDAQIGIVNGGGVRDNLPTGELTINDIIKIHPYNNELCVISVTGQQIADALEWSMKDVKSEYVEDGVAVGESGGFYQVSGVKFTVDTSIPSTAEADEKNMFKKITGERRVSDIMVLDESGEYQPLDLDKEYTIATSLYIGLNNGDGQTAFDGAEVVVGGGRLDNEVLQEYITEYLKGDLQKYAQVDDRITVK